MTTTRYAPQFRHRRSGLSGRLGCARGVPAVNGAYDRRDPAGSQGRWLSQRRVHDEQFVGSCRDHSLLPCALLRATRDTAARIRGGFGTCLVEGFHDDH
ncbi:hypothetical protein [Streptomyces sp. NPDC050121]|uniref:hypothetical protein n=1 Tax=Streptomyces sp. NPDC050121 TaxID=3365601 RepID=UPI0037AD320C